MNRRSFMASLPVVAGASTVAAVASTRQAEGLPTAGGSSPVDQSHPNLGLPGAGAGQDPPSSTTQRVMRLGPTPAPGLMHVADQFAFFLMERVYHGTNGQGHRLEVHHAPSALQYNLGFRFPRNIITMDGALVRDLIAAFGTTPWTIGWEVALSYPQRAHVSGLTDKDVAGHSRTFYMPEIPHGVSFAGHYLDKETGFVMRAVGQYDLLTDEFLLRFDVLAG